MEGLGFLIFRDDEPVFIPPGEPLSLRDGETVSLYHKAARYAKDNGKDFTSLPLKLEIYENGNLVARHSFTIDNPASTDLWLIADPAATDRNGSFSPEFASYLSNLEQGRHEFEVRLYVEGQLFQTGTFSYDSDGENAGYKGIVSRFSDVQGAREKSIIDHQMEYEQQMAEQAAEASRKNSYRVRVKNENTGKTVYVIAVNQVNYLERRYEVLPGQEITMEFPRGSEYMVLYFNQDQDKNAAQILTELNDLSDGAMFYVK